jgi:hypothetical protein
LEALFRKLKSLETSTLGKLGGRICSVVDLKTSYPVQTWFNEHIGDKLRQNMICQGLVYKYS